MPRVPKKNISGVLSDIRPSGEGGGRRVSTPPKSRKVPARSFGTTIREGADVPPKRKRRFGIRKAVIFSCVALLLGAGAYAALLYREKGNVYVSIAAAVESFKDSAKLFMEFRPGEAKRSLEDAEGELRGIRSLGERYGVWGLAEVVGRVWPALQQIPRGLRLIETLTSSAIEIADGAETLKANGVAYFTSGEGEKLLGELGRIREHTRRIREVGQELTSLSDGLGAYAAIPLPDDYLAWNTELLRTEEFLDGILALLGAPQRLDRPERLTAEGERHILLFFQNPSEMRPGGGFIGSYADVAIERGAMKLLDVRDIYDPDGQLDLKVIPPKPLQAITTSWGARDANWFFDFPTSAQKVIGFLEASKMYQEQNRIFEGAVAVNTDVIKSVLELTGPIELPGYKLTVDAENFLAEVQKEVEAGESKRAGEPKRILRDITPIILSRLKELRDTERQALTQRIAEHLGRGDITFYFRDPSLQNFFMTHGLSGAVADLPQPFRGDYLAVVNANVAGGKTDIYMRQEVTARSLIDISGVVKTDLTIARTHTGANARESWYRAANQNYLRVLTAPDVKLVSLTGATPKTVRVPINYEKNGYSADPDVVQLEVNEKESGKKAFGAWFSVKAGATGTLRVSYENPVPVPLKDGGEFTVILEQQSGVRERIRYELEAPPGYVWRETNDSLYRYESADPPKRVTVTLNLKKI
ncbi:MAG: DUF4012 domain-containing protein [bacterium]|nr:DUF4012 domain-containing protein [bacterium]